jgi:hypothetical protein
LAGANEVISIQHQQEILRHICPLVEQQGGHFIKTLPSSPEPVAHEAIASRVVDRQSVLL